MIVWLSVCNAETKSCHKGWIHSKPHWVWKVQAYLIRRFSYPSCTLCIIETFLSHYQMYGKISAVSVCQWLPKQGAQEYTPMHIFMPAKSSGKVCLYLTFLIARNSSCCWQEEELLKFRKNQSLLEVLFYKNIQTNAPELSTWTSGS